MDEPRADQLAQSLLDADVFDSIDATPVIGDQASARFFAELSKDSPFEYEVRVIRRRKPHRMA